MYYRTVWNDKLKRTQDLTTPEFLRISDSPRWKIIKIPWNKNQKFYHILDLDTGKEYYRPTVETSIIVKLTRDALGRKMASKKTKNKAVWTRYLIRRIPKILFIAKTKRKTDERREYLYKY